MSDEDIVKIVMRHQISGDRCAESMAVARSAYNYLKRRVDFELIRMGGGIKCDDRGDKIFFGIKLVVDKSLPADYWEIRDKSDKIIARGVL